jgi:hypothetical protein
MIESTLWLTWRRGLIMAATYGALLFGHFAVDALFHIDEQILFLGATILVPMWAISAAVYSFDSLMIGRGGRWRHSF